MTAPPPAYAEDEHELHGDSHVDVSMSTTGEGSIQAARDIYGGVRQLYNYLQLPAAAAEGLARRTTVPPPMNQEALARLRQSFVPPARFQKALDQLRASYTLVVAGDRGSGRRSAAMMLLSKVARSSHDLTIDAVREEDQVDVGSMDRGDGVLLDLSARPTEAVGGLLKRWGSFHGEVTAKQCFFVVVIPKNADHLLDADLHEHLVVIGRPDAREVFAQHLGRHGVAYNDSDLVRPDLVSWLERATMADVSALGRSIRDEAESGGGFSQRLERALVAYQARPEQVANWLGEPDRREEQALILAAAMLEGARTDTVFTAAEGLLDIVESEEDRDNLQRKGITQRLDVCGITVDGDGRVRFRSPDFDHQIRSYFWREHPGLRGKFCDWIGRIVPDSALDAESSSDLAVRFAEQALAVERPNDLRRLVVEWVEGGGRRPSPALLRSASMLLRVGMLDERFGSVFRKMVYDWALPSKSPLSPDFDVVLIDLCEHVIAPWRPEEALVRLRHLARREDKHIAEEAAERLNALADDHVFFQRALNKLAQRLADKNELPDVQLFLRVATADRVVAHGAGRPFTADGDVRGHLVTGWRRAVLRDVSTWEASARGWLEAGADDSEYGAELLDVLVEAGDRSTTALGRLCAVARRWKWEAAGEELLRRSQLVEELVRRVDASQQLEFLTTTGEVA